MPNLIVDISPRELLAICQYANAHPTETIHLVQGKDDEGRYLMQVDDKGVQLADLTDYGENNA